MLSVRNLGGGVDKSAVKIHSIDNGRFTNASTYDGRLLNYPYINTNKKIDTHNVPVIISYVEGSFTPVTITPETS